MTLGVDEVLVVVPRELATAYRDPVNALVAFVPPKRGALWRLSLLPATTRNRKGAPSNAARTNEEERS